jgi:hypothetical protein
VTPGAGPKLPVAGNDPTLFHHSSPHYAARLSPAW